ncbi:MAG: hypothetical protein J0L72_11145 [Armatimonadetes bacterium]|nr:hypothetical protein [Armatimonadota bacterium]
MNRTLTATESALFQVFSLAFSTGTSWAFGMISSEKAAQILVKSHAIKAVRRIVDLGHRISRLSSQIESWQNQYDVTQKEAIICFDMVIQANQNYIMDVSSILEDWRDIVPDEIKRLDDAIKLASENPVIVEVN